MRRSKSHQQIIAASERCSSDKLSRSSTGTDEGNHSSETSQISHSLRATISSLAINQPRDVEVIVTHQRTPSELPPDQVYPTNERDGKGVESVGAINHVGCGGGGGETDDEERSGAKVEYATVTKSDKRPRRDNQQKSKWAERDSQREKVKEIDGTKLVIFATLPRERVRNTTLLYRHLFICIINCVCIVAPQLAYCIARLRRTKSGYLKPALALCFSVSITYCFCYLNLSNNERYRVAHCQHKKSMPFIWFLLNGGFLKSPIHLMPTFSSN